MALVWDPAAVLNVVSGVLMGALGLALLVSRPRRDGNRLFGLLAVFWGIQIVSANAVRLTDDLAQALLAGKLTLAFLIPLYFFVVSFAAVFPSPRAPFGTSPLAVAALALPAAGALAALFLRPELLLAGVTTLSGGGLTLDWGPLLPYLVTAPFFGSLSYALYVMMQRLRASTPATERRQVGAVLGAFGLYIAYYAPRQLVAFGQAALGMGGAQEAGGLETWLIAAILLLTVLILAAVVVRLMPEGLERRQGPAGTALVLVGVGLAAAASVELVAAVGGPELELLGLVRSGSVAIIVYAIARYQLFDLELRAKRWAAAGAALLAAGGAAAAVYVGLQDLQLGPWVDTAATGLAAVLAFLPALHVSFRLADRLAPEVSQEGEHLYLRKLEVYRAALERKRIEGEASVDDTELASLRDRLGLAEGDHGVVATLADPVPRDAEGSLAPGEELFGKYVLEDVIGDGGFGRVFRARDTVLGRSVVVKELQARWREDEAVAEGFLQEARIAGQLDHPNIVDVHAVEEHAGDRFLVLEHVPGGTLADRLAAGPLAPGEAVAVVDQLLDALDAAHREGVVHRDVKPSNVLFDERDRVKLTDFGIAQLTHEDAEETITGLGSPSPDGGQPGTVAYMSPEQAAGEPVDERSDVYSAGAVLYRCLTGRPPTDIDGVDALTARQRVAGAEVPELSAVPAALRDVLRRALAPDPEDRYPSAQAFQAALEDPGAQALAEEPT